MLTYKQIKKGMKFKGKIPARGKFAIDNLVYTVIRKKNKGCKKVVYLDCAYLPVRKEDKTFGGLVELDFTMGELNYYLKEIPKDTKGLFI